MSGALDDIKPSPGGFWAASGMTIELHKPASETG